MLQFIYGRAATGKTYTVFEHIKNDVQMGKDVVLLVPEQFTFESERTLLHTLGDRSSTDVSVLSFTRLYDEVCRKVGGRVADVITEFDRVLLVSRAINSVCDNLKLWSRYKSSPRFAKTLAETITELKTFAVSPKELSDVADKLTENYLKNKLNDLALIYGAYNALLGNQFLDPADSISRLNDSLHTYRYFENKTVYIDSFKNFTGGQYKIIERILSQANDVICCLTTDQLKSDKNDIFYNVRKTADKIKRLADKHRCQVADSLKLQEQHYSNDELCAVEKALLNIENDLPQTPTEFVTLCKCNSNYDEANFAAQTIRRLVRTKGYRYRDFVIICRDAEKYQKSVLRACQVNGVFCFSDKRKPITYMPLTVFIDSLISVSVSFSTENILSFLKTGLVLENSDDVFEISNYIYLWNINGAQWREVWNMNPKEFSAVKDYQKQEIEKTLININTIRSKTVSILESFLKSFKGTPTDMARAILECLNKCNVADKLKHYADELTNGGMLTEADDIRQSWDVVMQIFDGIVKCLPEKEITSKEFIDAWRLAVNYATIGNIPQMLDEVTFGSADRIKPSRPKVAFVLGLNQNEFPKIISSNGIFADSERQRLIDSGIELSGTGFTAVVDEDYLAYTSLCCASERLYLSYSLSGVDGKANEPSIIVDNLVAAIPNLKVVDYSKLSLEESIPETVNSAEIKMCSEYRNNPVFSKTIEYALKDISDISIESYISTSDKTCSLISDENAKKLFGKNVFMSATQFDTYHRCRFSYFCKYGLKLKKIQPARFDALQRGTIVHYVMQRFITEQGENIANLKRDEIDKLVDIYISDYLSAIPGYYSVETERLKFLVGKITAIVRDVVYHVVREFSQSGFKPAYCELEIGDGKTVESTPVKVAEDAQFSIIGSIDRVDMWQGYLRVIDYKTGTKIFKLPDILLGLNMQMLIYLYSVARCNNADLNSLLPAGVLYMPSKREKADEKMTMNGIILEDEEVVRAMDKENSGEFVPKLEYTKEGKIKSNSFVSSQMFEGIFDYIEKLLKDMGDYVYGGLIQATPTDGLDSDACKYCDYYAVCCIEDKPHIKAEKMKNEDVLLRIKEEVQ
ncbi:MAG: PD-(D/E)XK nuclease family protein [Clostridia bacterium]|nr:PD-(D/E)XK nuclease family protein [Clostridia bacterium]